ncbi:Conserved_hypothetical protein [Hexamita inflata]|uniref:Uncharacterized protein n=1 Tax=Hexamita inflata TaxID=28002 RepID=A0AA86P8U5_9EUKA|nr:Conserved hypothetical protein [Hexamita inflata]
MNKLSIMDYISSNYKPQKLNTVYLTYNVSSTLNICNTNQFQKIDQSLIKQGCKEFNFINSNRQYYLAGEIVNPVKQNQVIVSLEQIQVQINELDLYEKIQQIQREVELKASYYYNQVTGVNIEYQEFGLDIEDNYFPLADKYKYQANKMCQSLLQSELVSLIQTLTFYAPKNTVKITKNQNLRYKLVVKVKVTCLTDLFSENTQKIVIGETSQLYKNIGKNQLSFNDFTVKYSSELSEVLSSRDFDQQFNCIKPINYYGDVHSVQESEIPPVKLKQQRQTYVQNYTTCSRLSDYILKQTQRQIKLKIYSYELLTENQIGRQFYFKFQVKTESELVQIDSEIVDQNANFTVLSVQAETCGQIQAVTIQLMDLLDTKTFVQAQKTIVLAENETETQQMMNQDFFSIKLNSIYKMNEFDSIGAEMCKCQIQFILNNEQKPMKEITASMLLDKTVQKEQIKILNEAFMQQFNRQTLITQNFTPVNQYLALKPRITQKVNILSQFALDSQTAVQLVLLKPETHKLDWYGIKIECGTKDNQGYYVDLPDNLNMNITYDNISARERNQQVIKVQFAVLVNDIDLGRINLFIKRQLTVEPIAQILLFHPKIDNLTYLFRYDNVTGEIAILSPDTRGHFKQLSDPVEEDFQMKVKVYQKLKYVTSLKQYQFVENKRYIYFNLPVDETIMSVNDTLTLTNNQFTFQLSLQVSDFAVVQSQVGKQFKVPLYDAIIALTQPECKQFNALSWSSGQQLIQVRTPSRVFSILALVDEGQCEKFYIKVRKEKIGQILFRYKPQIILEDNDLMKLGKLLQIDGKWEQQIIFKADVCKNYVTQKRLFAFSTNFMEIWMVALIFE